MLALLHCIYGNVGVACPVGAYINKVHVGLAAQFFPSLFSSETVWNLFARSGYYLFCFVNVLLYKVAQGYNLATFDVHHAVDGTLGTYAQAYKADAYAFYRFAL
jgi:hypothetical protein